VRIACEIEISAPREVVWEWITDPARQLHYLGGVTRWEVVGERKRGVGARYRMLFRVGSAEIGSLVEIVEHEPPGDLALVSVTGLDQRLRWRLRELPRDRSRVEFRLSYGIAGSGVGGWLAERIAAPTVRGHLRRSVLQLKRQVEQEQLRKLAAARRSARAGSAA
jgi:carbon monoxide dehydrogenase subunit G